VVIATVTVAGLLQTVLLPEAIFNPTSYLFTSVPPSARALDVTFPAFSKPEEILYSPLIIPLVSFATV
jgi:hypothetical protein